MKNKLILRIDSSGNGTSTDVTDVETGKKVSINSFSLTIGPDNITGEVHVRLSRPPMRIFGVYELVRAYDETTGKEVPLLEL